MMDFSQTLRKKGMKEVKVGLLFQNVIMDLLKLVIHPWLRQPQEEFLEEELVRMVHRKDHSTEIEIRRKKGKISNLSDFILNFVTF